MDLSLLFDLRHHLREIRRQGLPACQMILNVIGDLLTYGRQLKQFVPDERIVRLVGLLPIHDRLVP